MSADEMFLSAELEKMASLATRVLSERDRLRVELEALRNANAALAAELAEREKIEKACEPDITRAIEKWTALLEELHRATDGKTELGRKAMGYMNTRDNAELYACQHAIRYYAAALLGEFAPPAPAAPVSEGYVT